MVCKKTATRYSAAFVRKAAGRRRKRFCRRKPACWEAFIRRIISDASARRPSMSRTPSMKRVLSRPEFGMKQSEDCLYLNIWTPANTVDEKLPVAFWIHGGAFMHGFSHESEFDGSAYCERRDSRYDQLPSRCFRFLASVAVRGERCRKKRNYAILDQIAALKWVKENIAAFGGDPENITVFGQSAGCMSVQTLVSSPLTENWISKAIFRAPAATTPD